MTMRKIITTTMFGFVLVLGACDKGADAGKGDKQAKAEKKTDDKAATDAGEPATDGVEAVEAPSLDPKVEQAVTIANQISANPENSDSILEDAGLDREGFEKLLYEIALDPELSKSYAIAREA